MSFWLLLFWEFFILWQLLDSCYFAQFHKFSTYTYADEYLDNDPSEPLADFSMLFLWVIFSPSYLTASLAPDVPIDSKSVFISLSEQNCKILLRIKFHYLESTFRQKAKIIITIVSFTSIIQVIRPLLCMILDAWKWLFHNFYTYFSVFPFFTALMELRGSSSIIANMEFCGILTKHNFMIKCRKVMCIHDLTYMSVYTQKYMHMCI